MSGTRRVPILNKTNGLQYCTIHNCNVHESRRECSKEGYSNVVLYTHTLIRMRKNIKYLT